MIYVRKDVECLPPLNLYSSDLLPAKLRYQGNYSKLIISSACFLYCSETHSTTARRVYHTR